MTQNDDHRPVLYVLAGVNGAGKSSIGGRLLRQRGLAYFNPDEFARALGRKTAQGVEQSNAEAWRFGKELLERAIAEGRNHAFETTLGGNTMPQLIQDAAIAGHRVVAWYCGLASAELHIERVRQRVAAGGHDIPAELIGLRWRRSRENLIALMPLLYDLRVFDNSRAADPETGSIPPPTEVLRFRRGHVVHSESAGLAKTPEWAQPIVEAALQLGRGK
ncbi:zeta toxin family protein [Wenzhouxiangella sp. EGI_FJ10409]|uniref:zeta toxin family protein n=1 Tax=Wenzhouxiangella sp. EGI_FJ10409 TaxID=3243767 RepID=UPI0035DF609C